MTPPREPPFSLCVYCGSRLGVSPAYAAAATAVGLALAALGGRLVYGGGHVGLMGLVADAALRAGAPVIGIIPRMLFEREVGHRGLTELHVVETMHERKRLMAEYADAFLALPGGIGTLEELFEMWSWQHLGYHDKPLGLLEVDRYWSGLLAFMRTTVEAGFFDAGRLASLHVDGDATRLLHALRQQAVRARGGANYRAL